MELAHHSYQVQQATAERTTASAVAREKAATFVGQNATDREIANVELRLKQKVTNHFTNGVHGILHNKISAANGAHHLIAYRHSSAQASAGTTTNENAADATGGAVPLPVRNKMSKKQMKWAQTYMEKLNQINLHLNALFAAVEHGHLDKARTILESTGVDVNSVNSDGFSLLDIAVLGNNRSMTKMLLQHGALERSHNEHDFSNAGMKLKQMFKEAEKRLHDLIAAAEGQTQPTTTSCSRPLILTNSGDGNGTTNEENRKEIADWERRLRALRRLLLGWEQARTPDPPLAVTVDVIGDGAMKINIIEPLDGALSTKFRVQWSTNCDFTNICGDQEILQWTSYHGKMGSKLVVDKLTRGQCYFIRAACGNMKGWGAFQCSIPECIKLSHWRDLINCAERFSGQNAALEDLLAQLLSVRPAEGTELNGDACGGQKKPLKKKTSISLLRTSKQLFSAASKFQKNMKRGIYLACIVYCDDKLLVTSEDVLPMLEIDETYPTTLNNDYHWLMRVTCNWSTLKSLRADMERSQTSTANHFRSKLLSAICQMQSLLGLTDLGMWHSQPLRDSHGTVALTCVQSVRSQKTATILNSRWLPHNKLCKKISSAAEDQTTINEMLMASMRDQMRYHELSQQRLDAGLYLVYLKMQCSVEQMKVLVAADQPNFLPHYKIRENRYVTADEWQTLRILRTNRNWSKSADFTEIQRKFLYELSKATVGLLALMAVKSDEDRQAHRIYHTEVIELSADISVIVMCPSAETSCAVTATDAEMLSPGDADLLAVSIQVFEMNNLRTYQPELWRKYAQLSSLLEYETACATHMQREAFSKCEMEMANERLNKLHALAEHLSGVWKRVRWLADAIAFARDRNAETAPLAMVDIIDFAHAHGLRNDENDQAPGKRPVADDLTRQPVQMSKPNGLRASWPSPTKSENLQITREAAQTLLLPPPQQTAQQPTQHSAANKHWSSGCFSVPSCGSRDGVDCATELLLMRKHGSAANNYKATKYTCCRFYSSNHELKRFQSIATNMPTATSAPPRITSAIQLMANAARTASPEASSSKTMPPLYRGKITSNTASIAGATTEDMSTRAQPPCIAPPVRSKTSICAEEFLETKPLLQSKPKDVVGTHQQQQPPSLLHQQLVKSTVDAKASNNSAPTVTRAVTPATQQQQQQTPSGIIQVYTAYNTGLASGTSLKLHVTPKTSAREVINLVVKQLNMAAAMKGGSNGPIYTGDMLDHFCLVAVIGARERCLRDDFKLLLLQNPWKKGRLYVRQKCELLAAIEHASGKSPKSFQTAGS